MLTRQGFQLQVSLLVSAKRFLCLQNLSAGITNMVTFVRVTFYVRLQERFLEEWLGTDRTQESLVGLDMTLLVVSPFIKGIKTHATDIAHPGLLFHDAVFYWKVTCTIVSYQITLYAVEEKLSCISHVKLAISCFGCRYCLASMGWIMTYEFVFRLINPCRALLTFIYDMAWHDWLVAGFFRFCFPVKIQRNKQKG